MNKKKIKLVFLLLLIIACILIVWLCTITGAALAVSGAGYQGIFKNPMADPFVLGVSSGAALGAAIGIVCGFHFGSEYLTVPCCWHLPALLLL